jgi:FtsP/CotA-like multicopper oxidase with cupredoxin domain
MKLSLTYSWRRQLMAAAVLAGLNLLIFTSGCATRGAMAQSGQYMSLNHPVDRIQRRDSFDEIKTTEVDFTLITASNMQGLAFIGHGESIDGEVNPTLYGVVGEPLTIRLVNGDAMIHNLAIDELTVLSRDLVAVEDQFTLTFTPSNEGQFTYYCTIPGHRQAGMWGTLVVTNN